MVRFKIVPKPSKYNGVTYWCIFAFHYMIQEWVFVRSFQTEQRAIEHVATMRRQIAKGDYQCLTLRN